MANWDNFMVCDEIETSLLKQPDRPTAEFSQLMHVKGVIRYGTLEQAMIDEIAHWTFFGGIAVFVVVGVLEDRKKKKRSTS